MRADISYLDLPALRVHTETARTRVRRCTHARARAKARARALEMYIGGRVRAEGKGGHYLPVCLMIMKIIII